MPKKYWDYWNPDGTPLSIRANKMHPSYQRQKDAVEQRLKMNVKKRITSQRVQIDDE